MPDPELAERPRRRRFTAEYKLGVKLTILLRNHNPSRVRDRPESKRIDCSSDGCRRRSRTSDYVMRRPETWGSV